MSDSDNSAAPYNVRTWTDQQLNDFIVEYKAAGPMLQVITRGVLLMVVEESECRYKERHPK